jgi:hypothetical protein
MPGQLAERLPFFSSMLLVREGFLLNMASSILETISSEFASAAEKASGWRRMEKGCSRHSSSRCAARRGNPSIDRWPSRLLAAQSSFMREPIWISQTCLVMLAVWCRQLVRSVFRACGVLPSTDPMVFCLLTPCATDSALPTPPSPARELEYPCQHSARASGNPDRRRGLWVVRPQSRAPARVGGARARR